MLGTDQPPVGKPTGLTLRAYLRRCSNAVDRALGRLLPSARTKPQTLHRAMRYSLLAGGKRMRPALAIAAAEACGGSLERALPVACAVECVHTYSLIHDDLPCMDDDDFRRGRPTSHKVFGEAVAVLAGDALLAVAFEILADAAPTPRYPTSALLKELARASGSRCLVGGQVADLEAEGGKANASQLKFIHEGKTAAMISASLKMGAMSANATPTHILQLEKFGMALGHAFQVIDDILDCTQSASKLGKSAGKDTRDGKATVPSLLGLEGARVKARSLTSDAKKALAGLGSRAARLHEIADHLLEREF